MTGGVFVALGSNLDTPETQVRQALAFLAAIPGTTVLKVSSLYRTPPWGDLDQPDFINAVAEIATVLAPLDLLDTLLDVERRMGRVRSRRYGPRVIDLDLLLHGQAVVDEERLVLPHPRMHERAFVMWPLAEIAPSLEIDGRGRVAALAAALTGEGIQRLT